MKRLTITLGTCLIAAAGIACSPTVAGDSFNEAVQVKNGQRVIELPPKGGAFPETPPTQWEPPVPGFSFVLEGPQGLVECVQPYFVPNRSCNRYSPGMYAQQRERAWVVKQNGKWRLCPDAKTRNGCTILYSTEYPPFKPQI